MTDRALAANRAGLGWTGLVTLAREAPAWLLPLLMLTIPLEFTKQYLPTHLIEASRIVMVIIVVALGILWLAHQEVRVPALGLWLAPALFIAYAGVSAVLTRSTPGLKTFAAMGAYALVALAVFNWTRSASWQERIWLWFAVSCIGVSIITIFQRITNLYIWNPPTAGIERYNATFYDPNVLGRVLTIMIVTGVVLAPVVRERRARVVIAAAVVLSAAALPLTYSRQAWVLGGVLIVVAVVLSQRRRLTMALAGAALAVFGAMTLLVPEVQSRFGVLQQNLTGPATHIFERAGLAFLNYLPLDSERHYLIAAGLQMFYDHVIFGVGYGRFPKEIMGPYRGFILSGYTTVESHTSLVTILAELGLVGLVLAGWWGFEFVRRSVVAVRRDPSDRAYVIAPLLAVALIFLESQLNSRLVDEPYLWVFVGLGCAAIALGSEPAKRANQPMATTTSAATSQNSTARSFFQ